MKRELTAPPLPRSGPTGSNTPKPFTVHPQGESDSGCRREPSSTTLTSPGQPTVTLMSSLASQVATFATPIFIQLARLKQHRTCAYVNRPEKKKNNKLLHSQNTVHQSYSGVRRYYAQVRSTWNRRKLHSTGSRTLQPVITD